MENSVGAETFHRAFEIFHTMTTDVPSHFQDSTMMYVVFEKRMLEVTFHLK